MSKILNSTWFTPAGPAGSGIGIVKFETDQGEIKYYIGDHTTMDQQSDELNIAKYGARVHPEHLINFLTHKDETQT